MCIVTSPLSSAGAGLADLCSGARGRAGRKRPATPADRCVHSSQQQRQRKIAHPAPKNPQMATVAPTVPASRSAPPPKRAHPAAGGMKKKKGAPAAAPPTSKFMSRARKFAIKSGIGRERNAASVQKKRKKTRRREARVKRHMQAEVRRRIAERMREGKQPQQPQPKQQQKQKEQKGTEGGKSRGISGAASVATVASTDSATTRTVATFSSSGSSSAGGSEATGGTYGTGSTGSERGTGRHSLNALARQKRTPTEMRAGGRTRGVGAGAGSHAASALLDHSSDHLTPPSEENPCARMFTPLKPRRKGRAPKRIGTFQEDATEEAEEATNVPATITANAASGASAKVGRVRRNPLAPAELLRADGPASVASATALYANTAVDQTDRIRYVRFNDHATTFDEDEDGREDDTGAGTYWDNEKDVARYDVIDEAGSSEGAVEVMSSLGQRPVAAGRGQTKLLPAARRQTPFKEILLSLESKSDEGSADSAEDDLIMRGAAAIREQILAGKTKTKSPLVLDPARESAKANPLQPSLKFEPVISIKNASSGSFGAESAISGLTARSVLGDAMRGGNGFMAGRFHFTSQRTLKTSNTGASHGEENANASFPASLNPVHTPRPPPPPPPPSPPMHWRADRDRSSSFCRNEGSDNSTRPDPGTPFQRPGSVLMEYGTSLVQKMAGTVQQKLKECVQPANGQAFGSPVVVRRAQGRMRDCFKAQRHHPLHSPDAVRVKVSEDIRFW